MRGGGVVKIISTNFKKSPIVGKAGTSLAGWLAGRSKKVVMMGWGGRRDCGLLSLCGGTLAVSPRDSHPPQLL